MDFVFGDLPAPYHERDRSKVVIVPVPYDATSTWIKGANRGPAAIIEASVHMELYDIETEGEPFRIGIHTDDPVETGSSPEVMVKEVRERISSWLEREKFVVTLGGEHSVSIGAIQAHHLHYPDLCVLQLDAHTDLREEYEGSANNHACVMARARELCPVTQVGIRSLDQTELSNMDPARVFFQETLRDGTGWMDRVVETLNKQVYLTFDLDVLDPSIMPSTGTPEPGGMDWYTALALVRRVAEEREIIGFDVVELCPEPSNKSPDFLAARLVYKMLGYCFKKSF